MPKMNCLIFIWIALLLHTTEKVQSVRFLIIPSQDSPCPGEFTGDPCLTLSQYSHNRPTGEDDVILDLQPGGHRIDAATYSPDIMQGAKSFVVISSSNVSIICDRRLSSPFSFSSIPNIWISGINFIDCQRISITSVDNLTIQNNSFQRSSLILQQVNATVTDCSFTDTFTGSRTNPGALHIEGGSATIKYSRFIGNRRNSVSVDGVKSLFVSDSVFEGLSRFGTHKAINIANPSDSVIILRCNFSRNFASSGPAVSIQDGTSTDISFTDCNFMDNRASSRGGAFHFQSTTSNALRPLAISFTGCQFMRNSGLSDGGAFYIETSRNIRRSLSVSFTDCHFRENSASSGGGAFYIETSTNNIIRQSLNVSITDCHFRENSASTGGGALFINIRSNMADASVSLSRSSFINNLGRNRLSASGGAVYISSPLRLPLSLSECNFTNNIAGSQGGALYLQFSTSPILITQSYFMSNRLQRDNSIGGAVYISGNDNTVSVNEGAFINNTLPDGSGGALYSSGERTNFSFVDMLFLNNSVTSRSTIFGFGGAVYVSTSRDSNVISVKGSAFVNNMVTRGSAGALGATRQQTNFSFVDVLFHNNSASFCGVLDTFGDNVNITRSTFTSNRATGGMTLTGGIYRGSGAICIRSSNVSVVNSTFSNNSAVGNAGVMQIERSSVEIIDSKFEHNEATLDGGVTYTKLGPNTFTIQRSTFLENKAGDDGGVMYLGRAGSRVDVNESDFSLNRAADRGGAFVILGSTLNIAKSTFSDNTAARGDDINACLSEINTENIFETSTSSTTACISYNNLTLLPTEASTIATQTTEESATTRSMVRRTAPIIVPPQTIDPQTTAITPDYITTTDTPSRVSTTLASQTDSITSTMAQTDSISTLDTTSQSGQETGSVTTNTVTESSTTLPPKESTTTSGGEFEISTTSERESSTMSQPSMATSSSTTEERITTIAAEISTTSPERTTSTASPQSEVTSTTMPMVDTSTIGQQTEASTTMPVIPETEQVAQTTTALPQAETTTSIESISTTAETTQADTTTAQKVTEEPTTSTPTDDLVTDKTEDATEKFPPSTDNESLITQSDTVRGNNNAAGTIVLRTGLLLISVAFAFISAL